MINSIIYRSQRLDNLKKNLNISVIFNKKFNYVGENVPHILEPFIAEIVQSAQNLNLLEISDPVLFRMCLNYNANFVFFNNINITLDNFEKTLSSVQKQMQTIADELLKRMVINNSKVMDKKTSLRVVLDKYKRLAKEYEVYTNK